MPSKKPPKISSQPDYHGTLKPCPICGKPSTSQAHPFCSKRCADVDLHRWLGGTYAIPAVEADDSEEDDEGRDDEKGHSL